MRASEDRLTAEEFRLELERHGLTQIEAARIMGVNDRTVRRWALGERPIPPLVTKLMATIEVKPPPEPTPDLPPDAGEPIDDEAARRLATGLAAAEAAEAAREPEPEKPPRKPRKPRKAAVDG